MGKIMPQTLKLEDVAVIDSGKTLNLNDVNVVDSDRQSVALNSVKPIVPSFVSDYDPNVRRYGGIKAVPEKPWYDYVLDFGKEMIPYYHFMTKEGRMLYDSLPAEARANKNITEWAKALDWALSGDAGLAFFGKKFIERNAVRAVLKHQFKNVSEEMIDAAIKGIGKKGFSAFGNLVKQDFKPVVKGKTTGMPLLKPKKNLGQTYHPKPLREIVGETQKEQITAAIQLGDEAGTVIKGNSHPEIYNSLTPEQQSMIVNEDLFVGVKSGRKFSREQALRHARTWAGKTVDDADAQFLSGAYVDFDAPIVESAARDISKPEMESIVRKTAKRKTISELRRQKKPLTHLVETEAELRKKAEYEASKKGPPLIQPKKNLGQTYHPESIENILNSIKNQDGWLELDLGEVKKAIKEGYGKYYHKPITEKDMNAFQQAVSLPHWIVKKYPRLKSLYGIERKRSDARAQFSHILLENADDFFRLKGRELEDVQKLLIYGDAKGKVFSDEVLIKSGFNEKAIKGYKAVRGVLNQVRDDYWQRMKEAGIPDDEIMKIRQNLGNTDGYFPRVRYGKFFIKAEKEGATPVRAHYNNGFQGAKLKKELEQSGYKIIEEGKNTKLPEEVYFQVSPEAISAVFEHASRDMDELTRSELRKGIADSFKERGWLGHGISRQEFWKGFETENLKQVLFDYLNGYAGFTTKMDAARKFSKELMGLSFPKEGAPLPKNQYEWATKYVRDVMANSDNYDKISQGLRSVMFYKYLGGVLKSAAVNLTQNWVAAAPRLSLETNFAYTKLNKAMVDIVGHYGGKKLAGHEERALRLALQKGWAQEQYVKELMGQLGKYGSVPNKIKKAAGYPMAMAERFNRESTFLAGYRVMIDKATTMGMAGEEAFQWAVKKAGRIVEDSHFVYGKSNVPGALRGSPVAKLARSAYTFRTFTHNYLNLLGHLSRQGARGKVAAAKSITAIAGAGGVSSIPFFKTIEQVALMNGYNPRGWVKEKTQEYFGNTTANVALYGLPAVADIDIGGSIGIEMPGQRALLSDNFAEAMGNATVDILGVPASIVDDVYSSGKQLYYGDIYRAVEESPVTPVVVSNAMKARREYKEGATTPKGAAIERIGETEATKLTMGQALKKGIAGFQSVERSEDYRKYQVGMAEKKRWERKAERIKATFKKMKTRYGLGSKQVDQAWEMAKNFNKEKPVEVPILDPSSWIIENQKTWQDYIREEKIK